MVFVMKIEWGGIPKRLVWSSCIVFNQPLSQFLVKQFCVGRHVAELDKFFFQGAVKSFVVRIIFRGPYSRMVVRDIECG